MRKGIAVEEYSIEDLKRCYSPDKRINKRRLAELVAAEFASLHPSLDWGKDHKNTYSRPMFEAVALGAFNATVTMKEHPAGTSSRKLCSPTDN